jgi:LPS export ABC transporter protein LptC
LKRVRGAIAVAVGLTACSSGSLWTEERGARASLPPAHLEGVRFEGYRGGASDVEIRARSAEVDWDRDEVRLESVRIFLPATQRGPLEVQADRGRIDLASEGFVLQGEVVAQTGDGQRLETRELRYEPARRTLIGDHPVRVTGERLDLVGSGMELDVPTRRVRLRGPVRATTEGG